jgi:hypothetical protein
LLILRTWRISTAMSRGDRNTLVPVGCRPVLEISTPAQSSQMVSRSRSARLSPPQMLHRFLSLPEPPALPNPKPLGTSKLRLLGPSSSSSLSAINFNRCASSSTASDSRSGASSIVSRELMEGDRERMEEGVDEMELKELLLAWWWRERVEGKDSLYF